MLCLVLTNSSWIFPSVFSWSSRDSSFWPSDRRSTWSSWSMPRWRLVSRWNSRRLQLRSRTQEAITDLPHTAHLRACTLDTQDIPGTPVLVIPQCITPWVPTTPLSQVSIYSDNLDDLHLYVAHFKFYACFVLDQWLDQDSQCQGSPCQVSQCLGGWCPDLPQLAPHRVACPLWWDHDILDHPTACVSISSVWNSAVLL